MSGKSIPGAAPPNLGSSATLKPQHTFDWLFSDPFERENSFTPLSQTVPHVEDGRPIFVDELSGRILTKKQLKNDALRFAAGLQALVRNPHVQTLPPTPTSPGPQVAPVVLIQLPNSLQFAPILLGTLASDLTASLISPGLTSVEIAWVLQIARPNVIITATSCLSSMHKALASQKDRDFFIDVVVYGVDLKADKYPEASPSPSRRDWRSLLSLSCSDPSRSTASPPLDRAAIILWSSGTSGRSKGVLLSHHALNFSLASLWHDADFYLEKHQRWLAFVPFFHVFGLLNLFLLAVPTGSTVYIMRAFDPKIMLNAIANRQITYLHMAPPVAVLLAKSPLVDAYAARDTKGRNKLRSVVGGVTGGAPLGHDIVTQIFSRLGFRIRLGYGLTEACSVTLQPGLLVEEMQAQRGSTGQPHWGVEVTVATRESLVPGAKPALTNENGEIFIRSPGLMLAYLPVEGVGSKGKVDMSSTEESLTPDGWFRTGDLGYLSNTGGLHITDRIKELIKVKGYQVAPAELEAILCSSNEVTDAGVVGVYDQGQATEWPRAYVVPATGLEQSEHDLRALAHRLRNLVETQTARYKWLMGGIVFVQQIPKSPSGKILRRLIREGGVKGKEILVYGSMFKATKL